MVWQSYRAVSYFVVSFVMIIYTVIAAVEWWRVHKILRPKYSNLSTIVVADWLVAIKSPLQNLIFIYFNIYVYLLPAAIYSSLWFYNIFLSRFFKIHDDVPVYSSDPKSHALYRHGEELPTSVSPKKGFLAKIFGKFVDFIEPSEYIDNSVDVMCFYFLYWYRIFSGSILETLVNFILTVVRLRNVEKNEWIPDFSHYLWQLPWLIVPLCFIYFGMRATLNSSKIIRLLLLLLLLEIYVSMKRPRFEATKDKHRADNIYHLSNGGNEKIRFAGENVFMADTIWDYCSWADELAYIDIEIEKEPLEIEEMNYQISHIHREVLTNSYKHRSFNRKRYYSHLVRVISITLRFLLYYLKIIPALQKEEYLYMNSVEGTNDEQRVTFFGQFGLNPIDSSTYADSGMWTKLILGYCLNLFFMDPIIMLENIVRGWINKQIWFESDIAAIREYDIEDRDHAVKRMKRLLYIMFEFGRFTGSDGIENLRIQVNSRLADRGQNKEPYKLYAMLFKRDIPHYLERIDNLDKAFPEPHR